MTKLTPIFIDGKKWIQLSQLSIEQARLIKHWLPFSSLRKVLFRTNQVTKDKQALLDF
jgi:hypothetical protein